MFHVMYHTMHGMVFWEWMSTRFASWLKKPWYYSRVFDRQMCNIVPNGRKPRDKQGCRGIINAPSKRHRETQVRSGDLSVGGPGSVWSENRGFSVPHSQPSNLQQQVTSLSITHTHTHAHAHLRLYSNTTFTYGGNDSLQMSLVKLGLVPGVQDPHQSSELVFNSLHHSLLTTVQLFVHHLHHYTLHPSLAIIINTWVPSKNFHNFDFLKR